MSYLDRPRLHFFGDFTANPSTINNIATNYDMTKPRGGVVWNPDGKHNFSLNACPITSIVMDGAGGTESGTVATAQTGVLVDLDTEQQMVSMIFGMILKITVGKASVTGTFRPVNFFDIVFGRSSGTGGDEGASAAYQSVLTDLKWSGASQSQFLSALYAASPTMLSIRFVVDGFHNDTHIGRVAGTIGPYLAGEPMTFANARFLRPTGNTSQFKPFNFAPAKTDTKRGVITFDLGNAVPTDWPPAKPPAKKAPFPVANPLVKLQPALIPASGPPIPFGNFDTSEAAYEKNAFVQEFPIPKNTANPLASTPTGIVSVESGGSVVVMMENPTGAYVNADQYVFRLNPGETGTVPIWANIFETPASGATISLAAYNDMLQPQASIPVGTPDTAVSYPPSVTTDANGKASFTITASDPGNPRSFIDGQVYGIGFSWTQDTNPDPWAFISVHVFQQVPVPRVPTWWQDVFPILNQYSRLYPAMQKIIALNDYKAVVNHLNAIVQRLNLPETDPHYMPITRELSRDKKAITLAWAKNNHPRGREL